MRTLQQPRSRRGKTGAHAVPPLAGMASLRFLHLAPTPVARQSPSTFSRSRCRKFIVGHGIADFHFSVRHMGNLALDLCTHELFRVG